MIAWSLSSLVLPAATTALMTRYGPGTFIHVVTAVAALYALFVVYRLSRRDPVPVEDTEPYRQVSGQAPLGPELVPVADDAAG